MTEEEIALEFEMHLAYLGEPLKTCPACGIETHRPHCPACKLPDGSPYALTGDSAMDAAIASIEQNQEIDLEKIVRSGFVPVEPRKEEEA